MKGFWQLANPLADDLNIVFDATEPLWNDLRGARLFITGGTGFFGCWLLESLIWAIDRLNLNTSVVILTRDATKFRVRVPHLATHASVSLHVGELESFPPPPGHFSHLIHAAVCSDLLLTGEHRLKVYETMLNGTRHTLDFAVQAQVRQVLLTSTGAIYGTHKSREMRIPEDGSITLDPSLPQSAYAETRRMMELLCVLYSEQYDFAVKLARGFAFIGPYLSLSGGYAAGNFIRDGLNGGPIIVNGDGTPYRSYMYAADLAIWLWTIFLCGENARPYNVGSEDAITIAELAKEVATSFSPTPQVCISRQNVIGLADDYYVPDTRRAQKELGLKYQFPRRNALFKTIQWFSADHSS